MIYTVTFNPAIDYVMKFPQVRHGGVNRSVSELMFYGGKGINVSVVLSQLGVSNTALGFIAGFTGTELETGVRAMGVNTDFIRLDKGMTRINVKVSAEHEVTELNAGGPDIDEASLARLTEQTDRMKDGDTIVLAGSIPKCLPGNTYEKLIARLSDRNIRVVVDAEKELLTNILKYRPFLIKPNIEELSAIFGKPVSGMDEVRECAVKLREMGAQNVIVSMGSNGAFLLDENGEKHFHTAFSSGKTINAVGAGDSMVAGFLAGYERGFDYALVLGLAAGAATAFSEGIATREAIDELMKQTGF
ncbi:MAG: 1-phosphofructokinase [Ruminiclostridium sp.]|nr:1-phosphofructokinase [Ruminiclostridium sp.]